MLPSFRTLDALSPEKAHAFGGKAQNLALLTRAGFPVPFGYALTSELARQHLCAALGEDRLQQLAQLHPATAALELGEAARIALAAPIAAEVEASLRKAVDDIFARGGIAIAARSSAMLEDTQAFSSAGMFASHIGLCSVDEIMSAIRAVWCSALTPRVLAYLHAKNVRTFPFVGVVLQATVPADNSGVVFTGNPISGDMNEVIVNASFGIGTEVVDGSVTPDTFRIEKATRQIRDRVVGSKLRKRTWDGSQFVTGETQADDVEGEKYCIEESELRRLVDLALAIETRLGYPCDIEWASARGHLYVLQARPITTHKSREKRKKRSVNAHTIVWSNVNVGEALPGVATPLTWSILSGFSDRGFRRAFGALGCAVPDDAKLISNFRGRIYLNLSECLAIASQVPFLRPEAVLALGGGGELSALTHEYEARGRAGFLLRLPSTVTRFVRENYRLSARIADFEKTFDAERRQIDALDFRVLSGTGLHRVLRQIEGLLESAGLVLLNVYGNLLGALVVQRMALEFLAKGDADAIQRQLMTGLLEVESAAPARALYQIAGLVAETGESVDTIFAGRLTPLEPMTLPEGPIRSAVQDFLQRYGDRGAREAELSEPRWRDDFAFPLATIRVHVDTIRSGSTRESLLGLERKQREVRVRAEDHVRDAIPRFARTPFLRLQDMVTNYLRARERIRARVVTVLGLFRKVALDASRRIRVLEPDADRDAAFFLQIQELHDWLRGDATQLTPLVARRIAQHRFDAHLPAPPDTFVGSPPPPQSASTEDVRELTGLAASGGIAHGRARVLLNPADIAQFMPGEVLVVPQADVGWSPIFLAAAALVTDLGGPLSHACVVAREFGLPAVVNAKTATQQIHTGDLLEVHGEDGVIRILERGTT